VAGPSRLRGALMSSPDIRAGIAMLLAAVCAKAAAYNFLAPVIFLQVPA
jgi:UDP-N-acetylglucosamine 1-carboxyvinyltransferase